MDYGTFIRRLSEESGRPEADIKDILNAMPGILMELEVGKYVQTPMGTFTKKKRKPKKVKTINGPWTMSNGKIVVTLKPGKRLTVE